MEIKYSWKWFITGTLLPLVIIGALYLKDMNRYLNEKNYFIIIIILVFLILVFVNIYKFFIDCFINIDKDDLIVTRNFINFKKKFKLKEIEYIYTKNRWLVISVNSKEKKIRKDFIRTSQVKSFFDELASKTNLEIKSHD